ncbi:MAG TPA: hypothetical protein VET25_08085, partial [Aestuariivirgaceae bacterium]|nr:hypothetical protein [Aestuariivirgaceae bacterium]
MALIPGLGWTAFVRRVQAMIRSAVLQVAAWMVAAGLLLISQAAADEPAAGKKLTTQELAEWIDQRFAVEYKRDGVTPAEAVDDATFLRRTFLDLQGR